MRVSNIEFWGWGRGGKSLNAARRHSGFILFKSPITARVLRSVGLLHDVVTRVFHHRWLQHKEAHEPYELPQSPFDVRSSDDPLRSSLSHVRGSSKGVQLRDAVLPDELPDFFRGRWVLALLPDRSSSSRGGSSSSRVGPDHLQNRPAVDWEIVLHFATDL